MIEALQEFPEQFYPVPIDAEHTALFFLAPYQPFVPFPEGFLSIDAYYLASNKTHRRAQEIADALNAKGLQAVAYPKVYYKPLLKKTGQFTEGLNTLLYHPDYGSRFHIGCVAVNIPVAFEEKSASKCNSCGNCVKACPTGAITENGFDRAKCLRERQDGEVVTEETARLLGNRLNGCDICQRACPMNHDTPREIPRDLLDFLAVDNVIAKAQEGRKGLEFLAGQIGENYARPMRVLRVAEAIKKVWNTKISNN